VSAAKGGDDAVTVKAAKADEKPSDTTLPKADRDPDVGAEIRMRKHEPDETDTVKADPEAGEPVNAEPSGKGIDDAGGTDGAKGADGASGTDGTDSSSDKAA
jgi:hypothetical protein